MNKQGRNSFAIILIVGMTLFFLRNGLEVSFGYAQLLLIVVGIYGIWMNAFAMDKKKLN